MQCPSDFQYFQSNILSIHSCELSMFSNSRSKASYGLTEEHQKDLPPDPLKGEIPDVHQGVEWLLYLRLQEFQYKWILFRQ